MVNGAAQAVGREFGRFNGAAEKVARVGALVSSGDRVSLSAEAVASSAAGSDASVSGLEGPMVDMRVAKYAAIANMRVISASDEMSRALIDVVHSKR